MKAVNGVKIYRCGEVDWFYAADAETVKEAFGEMIGHEDAEEILLDDPIVELTQEEFDNGMIYWDEDGDIDRAIRNKTKISYAEALQKCLEEDKESGHFMTTEW